MTLYRTSELLALSLIDEQPIVEGFLSARDKVLVVGRWKAGKSILAQQLAVCAAGAYPFLEMNVPEKRTVLYMAGEGDPDELQKRAIAFNRTFPDVDDNVYYWPLPTNPINSTKGMDDLEQAIETSRPNLVIVDPIYAVMTGSMRDDDAVGLFVRNLNKVQALTDGAVVVMHHTHRDVRTREGETIEEGDEAVFGSMLWKAWARTVYLLRNKRGDKSQRQLVCDTYRRPVALSDNPLDLVLVEPDPLYFAVSNGNRTPTDEAVLTWLNEDGPSTVEQLIELTNKSERGLRESLTKLVGEGLVVSKSDEPTGRGGRPKVIYRVS